MVEPRSIAEQRHGSSNLQAARNRALASSCDQMKHKSRPSAAKEEGGKLNRKLNNSKEFTRNLINSLGLLSFLLSLPPSSFAAPGPDFGFYLVVAGGQCPAGRGLELRATLALLFKTS